MKKQLTPFITLIRLLKDRYNCFKGAVQLAQHIDLIILCSDNPPKLTPSQVNGFFDLCLEEDMKVANPDRMPLLGPFCCNKLDTLTQCSLATHLAGRHSALPLYTELLTSLARKADLNVTSDMKDYAVKLLFCYLDAGLSELFNELAPKLLVNPQVVQAILGSSKIWDRAKLDGGGLGRAQLIAMLPTFVQKRIATLTALVDQHPAPSNDSLASFWAQDWVDKEVDDSHYRRAEKWLRFDLSSGLGYVFRLVDAAGLTDLEGLAILDPLLSKLSSVRLGQLVTDADTDKMLSQSSRSLFVGLCRRLRLADLRLDDPEAFVRLLKAFSSQGAALEDLLNSLVETLPLAGPALNFSSIFKAILSRPAADWAESPELMKGVTSKIMAAWMAVVIVKNDLSESAKCIEMLIKMNKSFRPDVDVTLFVPFIARMTTESLRKLLNHLYWSMVGDSKSDGSGLDRHLISELLGRKKATVQQLVGTWFEAWGMLKCLIRMGDRPCMESFIALLSSSSQGERLAVQLALSSSFRKAFESLPVHSAGWKVGCLLLDHCIEGLGRIWKQTDAVVPRYPAVENFLRSTRQSMVLDGFDDRIDEAHHFCDDLRRSYRVSAQVRGSAMTLRVEIEKLTDDDWRMKFRNDWFHYDDRQKRLDTLATLRKDQILWEPLLPSETAAGIKRPATDPLRSPPEGKRFKPNILR